MPRPAWAARADETENVVAPIAASAYAVPSLNPNAETVAAMKAARRGDLVKVGKPDRRALGA